MKSLIKNNRKRIEFELSGSAKWRYFSPAIYLQYAKALPIIQKTVHGKLIDLGCGNMPYHDQIAPFVEQYDGLDLFLHTDRIRYISDIQSIPAIADGTYDSAICLEVLEHVPDPFKAAREIYRILKPGGVLVFTVPHLSRLHDEPNDYYRYTRYGVEHLMKQAGFTIEILQAKGGLFSFLGHQFSTVILALVWPVPILKDVIYWINAGLITKFSVWLDTIIDSGGTFPLGYIVSARKSQV